VGSIGTLSVRRAPKSENADVTSRELDRAARRLAVRSRREATGLFAGNYASAFRGGGLEFEESRPYVPGDDVRSIDQVATARTGQPFVKRFREERNHTLIFALDTSASMRFGARGHSKAAAATHALALIAVAAGRAGDRSALLAFDDALRSQVPLGRGLAHTWSLIRAAANAAAEPAGDTRVAAGIRGLLAHTRHPATLVLLSDFRDERLFDVEGRPGELRGVLAPLSKRCDVIAAAIVDPLEEALPKVGPLRITDPERPERTRVLDTGSRTVRERYREAALERRRRVSRALRHSGAEPLWLRSDASPLQALGRFFAERAARRSRRAR
jgi:uncharacterized protein (DUF58 family)